MRGVLWIVHVLSPFNTTAAAGKHLRQRIDVVSIAVGHVTAEQNDGMVEHRTVAIGHVSEALDKLRENPRVIILDESQIGNSLRKSTPMRRRVESFADSEILINAHAGFLDHSHRCHIGPIRLKSQCHHFELNIQMFVEVLRRAKRRIRHQACGSGLP